MSKRNLTLFEKFYFFFVWMFNHSAHVLFAECSLCRGTRIKRTRYKTQDRVYTATYQCMGCGATAEVEERWKAIQGEDTQP